MSDLFLFFDNIDIANYADDSQTRPQHFLSPYADPHTETRSAGDEFGR